MQRAAVVIGVRKTGSLQPLQAVSSCVEWVKQWAEDQRFSRIEVITDEQQPVTATTIKNTIKSIIDAGTFEQLIVYFAGHGVNIRYGEYWLLSGAPEDTQEAVNVEGSVVLARQCGLPHVVLISDACRTAAEGIQAQYVTGSEIFPNTGPGGEERCVDLFFASTLGKPALEVRDPADAARAYRAVYTDTLVEALRGTSEPPLERTTPVKGYVRPWPLKRYLRDAVTRRLIALGVNPTITQTPDARITSDETAWLAELPLVPSRPISADIPRFDFVEDAGAERGGESFGFDASDEAIPNIDAEMVDESVVAETTVPVSAAAAAQQMLREGLEGRAPRAVDANVQDKDLLDAGLARTSRVFGPDHFETQCGIKSDGKDIRFAWSRIANLAQLSPDLVRVESPASPATNVLLELADGSGTVLPVIPDFLTTLTFDEDGELENVSYEPSANTWRWGEFQFRADTLRRLRAIIATSARLGVFHLEGEDAAKLAREIQQSKTVDPGMAIYAAYAYHDQQERQHLNEMLDYLRIDIGVTFYDLALLTRRLDSVGPVFPPYPMLAQGWSLLNAFGARLPSSLEGMQRHVVPSLWTTFDPAGVDQLRYAMNQGDL